MSKTLTVGLDILDGSFEVDFSYELLAPVGEESPDEPPPVLRYRAVAHAYSLRRPSCGEILYVPTWMEPLLTAWVQDSGEVYQLIAREEGIDV